MISAFLPESSVSRIHKHYIQFMEIAKECGLQLPASPAEWPMFWSNLCNSMVGKVFPISFHDLRFRHQTVYKTQQELAKCFLSSCREWDMIQDGFEYSYDLLKYLSVERPDHFGVMAAIATNPTITQEILGVPSNAIGYFLVWKDARNMLCHKSSKSNEQFFYSLNPGHQTVSYW